MTAILGICLAIFVIGGFFKYAYKVAGFVLRVTGTLFIGFVLFYLACAAVGIDYHKF
jgi:hypothetical protein